MLRIFIICLLLITMHPCFGQAEDWSTFKSKFVEQYNSLDIAPVRLAYQDNFHSIKSKEELSRQKEILERLEMEIGRIDLQTLEPKQLVELEYIRYILDLNRERLVLETRWDANRPDSIPSAGIHLIEDNRDWYKYLLKRWLDSSVDVDSLYAFGKSEIQRAKLKIEEIRIQTGRDKQSFARYINSDAFFTTDADSVSKMFYAYHKWVVPKLIAFFPEITEIPELRITRGNNKRVAQVPGYYSGNTFYYNLFDKPFNTRQATFLYLHEALPGHHYEVSHRDLIDENELNALFNLPGYGEGWAAYVEEIAYELGLYQNIFDQLGRWEWDLIRSVRVVLDIGLNYHGWSDEKALEYWKKHIKEQDDIGRREIARMRRWPVQVITYKYGASKILEWKSILERKPDFDLFEFHKQVLRMGPLPYSVLEQYVLKTDN